MIYGFRGARGRFILNFEKLYNDANIIKLEQNYRSTQKILEGANNLISHNMTRKGKNLWTRNDLGSPIVFKEYYDHDTECQNICEQILYLNQNHDVDFNKIAILTRTNNNAKDFEQYLISLDIPYELHPNAFKFMQRKEIKIAFSFLLLLERPNDSIALQTILEITEGFGEKIIERLMSCVESDRSLH